jgi:hypothetical protein
VGTFGDAAHVVCDRGEGGRERKKRKEARLNPKRATSHGFDVLSASSHSK